MKKIGYMMSLLMGVTMSLFLSLTGLLGAGKLTLPSFLVSFLVSFVISMVIGLLIPVKRVSGAASDKLGLRPGSLSARCFEALISDLIYTPIMTFSMVFIAYKQATAHGAQLSFAPMFIRSLLISFVVAYVLIFIFMPLFLKMLMKRYGPKDPMGSGGPGAPGGRPPKGH